MKTACSPSPHVISATTDSAKISVATQLQEKLLGILANPASFEYEFANLRMSTVAVASHPKSSVRLFTYNIILKNGVFHHYGVIQRKTKAGIALYTLHDTAQNLPKDAKETTLENSQWIGGLYYQIFPHKVKKKEYFVVMQFDGHNINSNRSIIDVLSFEKDEEATEPNVYKPIWGAPLFRDGLEDPSEDYRVIFEYHKSSRILMRYEEEKRPLCSMKSVRPSPPPMAMPTITSPRVIIQATNPPSAAFSPKKPSTPPISVKASQIQPFFANHSGKYCPNKSIFARVSCHSTSTSEPAFTPHPANSVYPFFTILLHRNVT